MELEPAVNQTRQWSWNGGTFEQITYVVCRSIDKRTFQPQRHSSADRVKLKHLVIYWSILRDPFKSPPPSISSSMSYIRSNASATYQVSAQSRVVKASAYSVCMCCGNGNEWFVSTSCLEGGALYPVWDYKVLLRMEQDQLILFWSRLMWPLWTQQSGWIQD